MSFRQEMIIIAMIWLENYMKNMGMNFLWIYLKIFELMKINLDKDISGNEAKKKAIYNTGGTRDR